MRTSRPATASEIVEPLDNAVTMRIIETGATAAGVFEACTWLTADDQIGTETERAPRWNLSRFCEILKNEEPDSGEGR